MYPSSITFAPLAQKHIPALLLAASAAPDPWTKESLQAELDSPINTGFVALLGGQAVGFACFAVHQDTADLRLVAISPAHQKQGVAFALLCHSWPQLALLGATHCLLEVRASNQNAISLYKKLGFEALARRKGLFSHPIEDGFLMTFCLT